MAINRNEYIHYGQLFTDVEWDICKNQGKIFEEVALQGYNMESFTESYLHSDFCNRYFDAEWSHYQMLDKMSCLAVLIPEIEVQLRKSEGELIFDPDVAYWIGFTYRQVQIGTGVPSTKLAYIIPFDMMCAMYAGGHTISEDMCFERICDDFKLSKKPEFNK